MTTIYLVWAKMKDAERVVIEIFATKEQAEEYTDYWNERQQNTIYWTEKRNIYDDKWIERKKVLKQTQD